jgi:hypothetical protein
MNTTTAQIFVTTYGLYNAGFQFANAKTGYWVDCSDYDAEAVFAAMLEQEQQLIDEDQTDVEIMFTDYEGFPSDLYSESGIDFDLIEQYEALTDNQQELLEAINDHVISDFKEALEKIENFHLFDGTRADYAQEKTEECHDIPDYLSGYIDYDSMGRDMEEIIELSHNQQLINYNF